MKTSKNPFGLHTITPYLVVSDARRLIEFMENVFGAALRGELRFRDDQSVQHAEVQIGDSIIMLGEPMNGVSTNTVGLYTYVDDCDKTYQKALDAGARSVLEVAEYAHGDRYGGVEDFSGNTWWIVSHVNSKK